MKLINADLVIDTVNEFKGKNRKTDLGIKLVEEIVNNAPTVDAEPIVRCKDCKQWDAELECCTSYTIVKCTDGREGVSSEANDFCSRGE